jgi:hypothetical protein
MTPLIPFIALRTQGGINLALRVRPGQVFKYTVVSTGRISAGSAKVKIKPTHTTRMETYKVQTVAGGVATFHTHYEMTGSPHGATRGDGEQQLKANGEPPPGIDSYVFDTACISDLSYPKTPVAIGQTWTAKVESFGKPSSAIFRFTLKKVDSLNGQFYALIDVWAGNPADKAGIVGTGTYWISLKDGLPLKKTLKENFGNRWVSEIAVQRQ